MHEAPEQEAGDAVRAALIVAVIALTSTTAMAHTMTIAGAKRVASATADHNANVIKGLFPEEPKPNWKVRYCSRRSSHVIDCHVRYTFPVRRSVCDQIMRVRFSSGTSTRIRIGYPFKLHCYPIS